MKSKKLNLKGDIVITDPCYVMNRNEGDKPQFETYLPSGHIGKLFTEYTQEETNRYKEYSKALQEWQDKNPDPWNICNYGGAMHLLGFTDYIAESTLYGDWGCTTYEVSPEATSSSVQLTQDNVIRPLGEFCADSGMVGVFLLSDILQHYPDYLSKDNLSWTATIIHGFDGVVEYVVEADDGYEDQYAYIRGIGNINFVTSQTSL